MLAFTQSVLRKHIMRFLFAVVLFSIILLIYNDNDENDENSVRNIDYINHFTDEVSEFSYIPHWKLVDKFYKARGSWKTSNVGSILFKNADPIEYSPINKTFVILMWKHWDWLQRRHVFSFGKKRGDPLDRCSVRNCKFVGNDSFLESADAVVVHLLRGLIPTVKNRKPYQRWVFLSDESPANTFTAAKSPPKLSDLGGLFNWSMSYRTDSDIPVPYGRTVPREAPVWFEATHEKIAALVPHWKNKRRDVLAAVLMSNCVSRRMKFLKNLKKYVSVDVFGKCSENNKNSCPGHVTSDCEVLSEYVFYLALENSLCDQYFTEKIFHNAYSRGAIPVIQGPPIEDCEKLLPPNSYLYVDHFESIEELSKKMAEIGNDDETLLSYHLWRNQYEVLNEHGYFRTKSYHLCRICQALNYNDPSPKVYSTNDLRLFLDGKLLCDQGTW